MADTEAESPAAAGKHERSEVSAPERTVVATSKRTTAARRGKADEVAARSADGSSGATFQKVFVLGGSIPQGHPQHEANEIGVLQEALHRGLHPKGKVKLTKVEESEPDRRGQVSTTATYEVPVEPAVTDTEAHTTVTPSSEASSKARNA